MVLDIFLSFLRTVNCRSDEDFVDRAQSFLTSNILIALSILVSWKQFGGTPIECLLPKMFPESWNQYAENYCWAQDTYFLPFDEQVPKEIQKREERQLSYYQWVPFFLLIEAACFRLPSLIWKYLAGHSGIKIHDIVKLAVDEKNVEPECKKANIQSLTTHLMNALRFHRRLYKKSVTPHRILRFLNLPYTACFVTSMYLLTKLLYLVNVCLQLYFMNLFLETDKYSWYGFAALRDIMNGTTWEHSGVFPRVTLCDFQVRVMGNIQRYSVQCVLVINIFNEKIFIFLWFWYTILMGLTAISFVYWLIVTVLPCFGRWFISRHMELSEMPFDPEGSKKDVERFVVSYLKTDGVFVLRMITMHSGIIFGTDLVLSLWKSFYMVEEVCKRTNSEEARLKAVSLLTPTPPTNADENKLNFLRLRVTGATKKPPDDDDDEEEEEERRKKKLQDCEDDDLTERLIPPSRGGVPSAPPKPPPKPSVTQSLDQPDSRATTIEMDNEGNMDRRAMSLKSRLDSRGRNLRLKMPHVDFSDDYSTARSS